jgi:enoyl-CoA hydratase/carnithine racemase
MEQRIKVEITAGVADVRLVRTDKMNALDDPMFAALVETIDQLKDNRSVRAVVLSGDGRAFCAGLDAGNFGKMAEGDGRYKREPSGDATSEGALSARTHGPANRAQYVAWGWRALPVPVIAAVHGVAFGGGFQLMLGADMRYIAPDAKLSIMEIKWGLVPDMAGTQLMRHIVREDIIRELSYTGRVFSGEEAGQLGFATRVVADPRAEALAVAREIAGKNPDAIRAAKRIYNNAPYQDAAAGLLAESVEQIKLIGSKNQVEAVMANLQKRDPVFTD